MKKELFTWLILLPSLLAGPAWPAVAKEQFDIFEKANVAYREGRYADAIEQYGQLVKAGHISPEVYFNLGNALYKAGDIPQAILHYERARRLDPADPDIAFNLQLANLQTVDKIEPVPEVFYRKWWKALVSGMPADGYALRGLVLLWLAFGLGLAYLFVSRTTVRKISFFTGLLVTVSAVFLFYLAARQVQAQNADNEAIVTAMNVYIKSSPDETSTNLFMLHAGTKITILDELAGWKRIRIANGSEGWAVSESAEII